MLSLRYILGREDNDRSSVDSSCASNLGWNHNSLSVLIWLYYEGKGKRETIREIAKTIDDPSKLEDLL